MAGQFEVLGFHERQQVSRGNTGRIRLGGTGEQVFSEAGLGKFGEAALKGQLFRGLSYGLTLDATSGNLYGSSAANAVTASNTALVNPAGSGVVMSLQRVALSVHSGTLAAGGVVHAIGTGHTIAATLSGMAQGYAGAANGSRSAGYVFTKATGAALTGASLGIAVGVFAGSTAGASANVYLLRCVDDLDGSIALYPGDEYRPQFAAVGTTVVYSASYKWVEVPLASV